VRAIEGMMSRHVAALWGCWLVLAVACGGGDDGVGDDEGGDDDTVEGDAAGPVSLVGAAEKGPFVVGASIQVAALDGALEPTGQVFTTQTTDDAGAFDVALGTLSHAAVAIEGSGFYFNERAGTLSGAPITLRALAYVGGTGPQPAFVNVVTHLAEPYARALAVGGMPVLDAEAAAEAALITALGIGVTGFDPGAPAIESSILGGDTDAGAYLLAVSAVLLEAAVAGGGPVDAALQERINTIALDLADDGALEPAVVTSLAAAETVLDTAAIRTNLAARLVAIGSTAAVPELDRVLDADHDDVANLVDTCPATPDPGQADTDADEVGDACDNCPLVANIDQFDADADGIGDQCDGCQLLPGDGGADPDADGIGAACDNCPVTANTDQADTDGDLLGDACDLCPEMVGEDGGDPDGDGVGSYCDNCSLVANPDQSDLDGDTHGDVCDLCPTLPPEECGTSLGTPDLIALTPSVGTLSPWFNQDLLTYTLGVPSGTTSIQLTPVLADPVGATVTVAGVPVATGTPSAPIALAPGSNPIAIVGTTIEGLTVTYTVDVRRVDASVAGLVSLAPSAGAFAPAYAPARRTYQLSLGNAAATVQLTPVVSAGATVTIDGAAVASGSPSAPIALPLGGRMVDVVVTSADASSTIDYRLLVVRAYATPGGFIKAINARTGGGFGVELASSGDRVAVVAGDGANVLDPFQHVFSLGGVVHVYAHVGADWIYEAYLKPMPVPPQGFGHAIALDGDTLVVGAHGDDTAGAGIDPPITWATENSGSAWVYVRAGGTWVQQARIKASDPTPQAGFGYSIAIDGNTMAVGAYGGSGAVYVFTRAGSTWSQQAILVSPVPQPSGGFGAGGIVVAGDTLFVGAHNQNFHGEVFVYSRSGTTWTYQTSLVPPDTSYGFGDELDLDGSTLAVGASTDSTLVNSAGAVYVYTGGGTTWTLQATLVPPAPINAGQLGESIDLDGDRLVAGAWADDHGAMPTDPPLEIAGGAHLYTRTGTSWAHTAYYRSPDVDGDDRFGGAVCFVGDTVVVGSAGDDGTRTDLLDDSLSNSGAVLLFE
jgi:hypothetical protein